jgi:hypothetical protein
MTHSFGFAEPPEPTPCDGCGEPAPEHGEECQNCGAYRLTEEEERDAALAAAEAMAEARLAIGDDPGYSDYLAEREFRNRR